MQVIRASACIGIFLYHAIRTFPGEGALYNFFAKSLGPWGVSVFFVLSGFLMTYSYWNRPPKSKLKDSILFSIYKIKKLFPLHLLMLFCGVVYLLLHHIRIIRIIKYLTTTLPLIQTWFPIGYQAINPVAWYLSVCVFLYFCFPRILHIIKRNEKISFSYFVILNIFLIQLLIGYYVFRFTKIDIKWVTYCHPVFRLGDFVIGCFLASIYLKKYSTISKQNTLTLINSSILEIVSTVLNVFICVYYANSSESTAWFTYTSLFLPSTVLLIYAFSLNSGIISKTLSNDFVFWLANISPYVFLTHRLVIYYFYDFMKYIIHCEHVNFTIVILITFVFTVFVVYIYLLLEKAFLPISNKIRVLDYIKNIK